MINLEAVIHEIYSYGGMNKTSELSRIIPSLGIAAVERLLAKINWLLNEGGQLQIMDGVMPDNRSDLIAVQFDQPTEAALSNITWNRPMNF